MAGSPDKGRVGHIIYFDFSKAFYNILIGNLLRHEQETCTTGWVETG